jgi:hypothetical protein
LSKKNFHEGPESEMHILFTRLCFFFLLIHGEEIFSACDF